MPILPALIAGVATGALGIGGQIAQSKYAREAQDEQNRQNMRLAEYEFQRNKEMFHLQNQYNSPTSQMARLKEAGLNPNLVYGSGAVGNTSSPAPKFNAPMYQQSAFVPNIAQETANAISMYQTFKMNQAQYDAVEANRLNTLQRTKNEALKNVVLGFQGKRAEIETRHAEHVRPYQAAVLANQAKASNYMAAKSLQELTNMSIDEQIKSLQADTMRKRMPQIQLEQELKQAELMYKNNQNEWNNAGVTSSDHPMLRILVRMLNDVKF